jgi:hypothetical protein
MEPGPCIFCERAVAIDYLVTKGFRASEAVEFMGRVCKLGKKPKAAKAPKTPREPREEVEWPEGFALSDDMRRYAVSQGVDADRLWRRFESVSRSTGRKYKRWEQAWRTWVNTEAEKRTPQRTSEYIDGRL